MPSTYSTNLALELPGTGDQAGTWGNTTNTNLGTLIEQAISGYQTQALTSGVTLTLTIPNGATGVARNMFLEFTGNGSTVIVPSNKKLYFVYNNCTSGTITMKVAGQTGVTIANGAKQILVSDGTDIEEATSYLINNAASLSVTNFTATSATISSSAKVGSTTNVYSTNVPFQVKTTGATAFATFFKTEVSAIDPVSGFWNNAATGDNQFLVFATETVYTPRGSITYNRAGGLVAYNTSSDRRAKTIYGPVTNSGQLIDQLNVYQGKMNWATAIYPMMIADEVQQVIPFCVTGEAGAVNPDGSPKYQQVDYSSVVPLLIAEIQSLRARVSALENT